MNKKRLTVFIYFTLSLTGCTSMYQVSTLRAYNGPRTKVQDKCHVVRTSLESKFTETIHDYGKFILGDSHVETGGTYENEEAAYDCMSIGAKSILVLDRGVLSSSTSYVPGMTSYNYYPSTNQVYSFNYGYYTTTNTSGFIVVFFNNELPIFGNTITMDMYDSWKRKNGINSCEGCQ